MNARRLVPVLMVAALAACESSPTTTSERVVLNPNFQAGSADGWVVGFADYPVADSTIYELQSGVRPLPLPLDITRRAIFVAGSNRSDDLFMFLKRRVDGLAPGAEYEVRYEIELASEAGSNCAGIGGAPGESVYLKAGATTAEPQVVIRDGFAELSVDKGQQAAGGPTVPVVGDVANGGTQCVDGPFRLKSVDSAGKPIRVKADASGHLWLLVGTDSGYEGTTRLYYKTIRVTLER